MSQSSSDSGSASCSSSGTNSCSMDGHNRHNRVSTILSNKQQQQHSSTEHDHSRMGTESDRNTITPITPPSTPPPLVEIVSNRRRRFFVK